MMGCGRVRWVFVCRNYLHLLGGGVALRWRLLLLLLLVLLRLLLLLLVFASRS